MQGGRWLKPDTPSAEAVLKCSPRSSGRPNSVQKLIPLGGSGGLSSGTRKQPGDSSTQDLRRRAVHSRNQLSPLKKTEAELLERLQRLELERDDAKMTRRDALLAAAAAAGVGVGVGIRMEPPSSSNASKSPAQAKGAWKTGPGVP